MRPIGLIVAVGILGLSLAGVASAGSIPTNGCYCLDDSLHCYNMRRDVSGFWGEVGANHTFTMCQDRYGNTSVWEDNWANPNFSQSNLGGAWVEEDMGCIKLDSIIAAKADADQAFGNACPGYNDCAGNNSGYNCQNSYWPFEGCYCFPWQMGFRSRLQHAFVIECPTQGGNLSGGSSDPSDYDYGPYYPDEWPQYEDDGVSLWRVCIDYCTATVGSYLLGPNGERTGGSTSCVEWNTECSLEWYYN
jgi:hypothetical protein